MAAREPQSSPTAGIVCGGGWKHSQRTDRLKVKAWVALFVAIGFGHVAVAGADSVWVFAVVPATVCLIASIFWFLFERAGSSRPLTATRLRRTPIIFMGRKALVL